jgi:hypothetical protein
MFNLSLPAVLINLFVVVGVIASIAITQNPLCILGFFFMVPLPHFSVAPPEQEEYYDEVDGEALDGEYGESHAGFTGTLK